MITISATQFRAELYKMLETVLATGQPIEVALRGRKVRIVPAEPVGRLESMEPHAAYIVASPDDLVAPNFDSKAWERGLGPAGTPKSRRRK